MMRLERSATSANTVALSAGSGGDCVAGMLLVLSVAKHAVCADRTLQAPIVVEQVQVCHRLAHGEEELVRVELAAKQRIEHVRRGPGRLAGFVQLGKPQAVMLLELRDPLPPTPERQAGATEPEPSRRPAGVAPFRAGGRPR